MSLALYRTYRPGRLSEVIGQEHVTEPLRRALEAGRVHHAFLFSGPRGCGKTSTARILARSLLCEQGPTPDPCGVCDFCVALAPTGPGLIDVIELDAASHGGVDDTRELRERAAFVPAMARYKIYIIDEAHMVSKDGFNALLKLIEEPPDHVKFIFATTEVDKVLPTIRSRTFNYSFRLVPIKDLQGNLAGICDTEGVDYEPAALGLIARASGGSVRDAQSIMGQLIAGAGLAGLQQAYVAAQLGVTDDALLDAVVAAVADHDGPALFAAVEDIVESGHDVRRFVTDVLHRFRDLLIVHHAGESVSADVLDVSEDQRDRLVEQAKRFGTVELTRLAEIINTGLTQVKGSTSPRLQLEILAARLLVPPGDGDSEATQARIEVLERRMAIMASATGHAVQRDAAAGGPAVSLGRGSDTTAPTPPAVGPAGENDHGDAMSRPEPGGPGPTRFGPDPTKAGAPGGGDRATSRGAPFGSAPTGGSRRGGPPPKPVLSGAERVGPRVQPDRPTTAARGVQEAAEGRGRSDPPVPSGPGPVSPTAPADGTIEAPPGGSHAEPDRAPEQATRSVPSGDETLDRWRGGAASTPARAPAPGARSASSAGSDRDALLQSVIDIWDELMVLVAQQSRVAAASWEGGHPFTVSEGTLVVQVPTEGQARSITQSRRDLMLRTLLVEHFRLDLQVRATAPATTDADGDDRPSDDDPDLASGGLSGVDLAVRELGATKIGEIEGG